MSDQLSGVNAEEPRGTFGFERKVNVGNYESATASIFISFPINADNAEVTLETARNAAVLAKGIVFDELGIKFEIEDGIVRELLKPLTETGPSRATTSGPPAQQQGAGSSTPSPSAAAASAAPSAPAASPSGGNVPCPVCGGATFDNTSTNVQRVAEGKKKVPTYRCRANAQPPKGTGCAGIIW